MRILAIRGENLASLGQPFTIDFEVEPLVSTGLFAITGETGSGKSTILDALCLALYGEYPRFTQSQQDALPDPSGAKASIANGSTILRRGAGNGYAEVDFIGQDSQRYRVRWEARRARNKPDGAIQTALRTLHLLQGPTLTPVATTKTEVQRIVETQTGLTFDQFCRTVLLPQGEFDAFLLAQKNERGALLEKITGTEIYGRISKIVYEGTRKLKVEAEQLETQLTNLGLLAPAERESIEQTILALQGEVTTKATEEHALRARIAAFENLDKAQQRLIEAEGTLVNARAQAELSAPDRTRLTELQAAEPLRPVRDRLTKVLREHPPAEQKKTAAKEAFERAGVDATEAETALTSARSVHDQAEQDFRSFAPIWNEAARLDAERTSAQAEVTSARASADTAHTALDSTETELDTLAKQIETTETARQNATAELDVRAHLLPLADQLSSIEALFERYESSAIEAAHQLQQQAEATQNAARLRETLTALDVKVEADTRSLQQTVDTAQTLQQELEDSQEDKWQTEEVELTSLHRHARDAEHIAERFQTASSLYSRAQAEYQAATTSAFEATTRAQSFETALREQTKQREEKQHTVALAEQSLDERNAHLRSLLVDGESCPICGATEHPYAAPGADDALTILAEKLRKERSALDAAISLSNRELQKATTERTAAEGQVQNAERNSAQGTGEMQKTADEFRVLRAAMEPSCIQFGVIAFLPTELTTDAQAASLISELIADVEARRLVSNEQLSALKNLRRQLDDANKSHRDAQAALHTLTRSRDKKRDALHALELQVASASEGVKQSTARLKEIETALSPSLLAADISSERLSDNAGTILAKFRELASEVTEVRTRITDLSAQGNQLASKQAERTAFRQHLVGQAKQATEAFENREEIYRQLSDARALLLAGEDTSQHRTRINADRLNAQTALQAAQTTYSTAGSNLARASEQERSASMALTALLAELAGASEAYSNGCSSLNIESSRADKLLCTSSSEIAALKARLDALDRAIRDAENTVTERQSVLDSLPVIGEDTVDRAQLAAVLDNLSTSLNLSREQIGIQKGRIEYDDTLRLTAADLRRQANEKDDELAIWQEVETAIGSANGDRFRTFAQSLTLEHLVQLANEHLVDFSRRYQLAPDVDLSLHVIDNDMGEEHRAIRSLSGGERFLVSLSLALSLAGLEGHDFSVDTLFIDEGFGALDADTLDIAITALETLHGRGRKVGVITHVAAMIESIPVQVKVEKLGGGSSIIRLESAASYA
jgi:exonuclease SbcC